MEVVSAREIYHLLLGEYGRQGWWPVTPPGEMRPSYCGGPANDRQRFEVMVGAILTQNTSWTNVEKAVSNMQAAGMLNHRSLLQADDERIASLIRPSGYFNQKAKKLKILAEFVLKHPISQLKEMPTPKLRPLLLGLYGVGEETADSIVLYSLQNPSFVVDAYTKRIFSRLGLIKADASYQEIQAWFHAQLKTNHRTFNQYHALIVHHAKETCRSKPLCQRCVLCNVCQEGRTVVSTNLRK